MSPHSRAIVWAGTGFLAVCLWGVTCTSSAPMPILGRRISLLCDEKPVGLLHVRLPHVASQEELKAHIHQVPELVMSLDQVSNLLTQYFQEHGEVEGISMSIGDKRRSRDANVRQAMNGFHKMMVNWCVSNNRSLWISLPQSFGPNNVNLVERRDDPRQRTTGSKN